MNRKKYRYIYRQTERKIDRYKNRQIQRKQIDRETERYIYI